MIPEWISKFKLTIDHLIQKTIVKYVKISISSNDGQATHTHTKKNFFFLNLRKTSNYSN